MKTLPLPARVFVCAVVGIGAVLLVLAVVWLS